MVPTTPTKRRGWQFGLVTGLAGLLVALATGACGVPEDRTPVLPGARGGLTLIADPAGQDLLDLEALRGHVLLLDFWLPWSKPSQVSLPALRSMQEDFAEESFTVIGMTAVRKTSPELIEEIAAFALPYPVVLSEESVNRRMGAGRTIPTRVLVGRDGAVLRIYRGWVDLDRLRDDVEHALRGEPLPPPPSF